MPPIINFTGRPSVAKRIAPRLVIPAHREGGQAQFISRPIQKIETGQLAKLLDWMRAHIAEPHSTESLAKRMTVSERTLHRQFMAKTGLSPYEWLLRERFVYTKELLENTAMTLSEIVEKTGFISEESLRKHFRHHTGISPGQYRKQCTVIRCCLISST